MKKIVVSCVNKGFALRTQKMHCKANLFRLPHCSPLDLAKILFFHFFIFSFFNRLIGVNPTTFAPRYIYIQKKWLTMSALGLVPQQGHHAMFSQHEKM